MTWITISIHALLAESDIWPFALSPVCKLFLSTLSLRRATGCECAGWELRFYFYPRSPCGERLPFPSTVIIRIAISIHALLAESDEGLRLIAAGLYHISIHALLAESDSLVMWDTVEVSSDFYPRSPCGERRGTDQAFFSTCRFLSTLSLRRATFPCLLAWLPTGISIHALLAESDNWPPVRDIIQWISIHALLAESDDILSILIIGFSGFLSTLSLRRATKLVKADAGKHLISIHALLAESD